MNMWELQVHDYRTAKKLPLGNANDLGDDFENQTKEKLWRLQLGYKGINVPQTFYDSKNLKIKK